MAFDAMLTMDGGTAKIALAGELDAVSAPAFKAEIEKAMTERAQRLVLLLQDLEYIASAGLRVLIFAKQKMGANVDVYVIGAQEQVMDTFKMTGFANSVIVQDSYDAQ